MNNIEYVIYCRKSTDETSDKQMQSIPDQIRACINYAKNENLVIKERPKDFSMFESELELYKEDNETDINNRRTYQETRNLFIIKEQETWKIAWKRKKWKELIKLIKNWKINGLISYSPDRQSRNMLEWWEIIDLVDKKLINLKYANFHFEDTPSWKMMLGIWFVFSKQYSDKLSEDVSRWNKSHIMSWKAIWMSKPGYRINKEWYHEPDPKNFALIKEAFEKKLNFTPESEIADFLNANWYCREYKKKWKVEWISRSNLWKIFKDEFYYWMLIHWDSISDLRETNPYYKPMITEGDFQILKSRVEDNPTSQTLSKQKDIYEEITPFRNTFLLTEDWYHLTFSLPNRKRFFIKVEEATKEWKILKLQDVVKPSQINYRCINKNSKYNNLSVSVEDIDKAILKKLKDFKVWENEFNDYVNFANSRLDSILQTGKERISSKTLEIWRLKAEKTEYIKNNMSIKKDKEEWEIYENVKADYDRKIAILTKEIENLNEWERNEIVELEVFMDVLNQARNYYKRANYVQKWKIANILFLNIKIDPKKRLHIQVKPEFETLFSPKWFSP